MNWNIFIETESKKEYYQNLMKFVDDEYKYKEIFPKREDLFNAFDLTAFENVSVVIIGQDPYHNVNQAHGLAFSVKKGNKIPPSLRNIYTELLNDLGVLPSTHGDLTEWANQGMLLMNTVFSVEAHKPHSHKKKGWEIFTDNVIKELNNDDKPKVFILWGNPAIKKEELISNPSHLILKSSHPSPLSARHSFFGSRVFSQTNKFLKDNKIKEIDFNIT